MRSSLLAAVLVILATASFSAGLHIEPENSLDDDGDFIAPLADSIAELEAEEGRRENGPRSLSRLSKRVKNAKTVKQVKSRLKKQISVAMKAKKRNLLWKANEASGKETTKLAARQAQRRMRIEDRKGALKLAKFASRANMQKAKQQAKEQEALAALAKAKANRRNAESHVRTDIRTRLLRRKRLDAEEEARTATALRLAAEEKAKESSAQKIAAEEEAKKAAALRVVTKFRAKTAQKSVGEINAMEAAAFRGAAALKEREGEALRKLAEEKASGNAKKQVDRTVKQEANDRSSLSKARGRLRDLVGIAKKALRKAKAKPFSKRALERVVALRKQVKQAKQDVISIQGNVRKDKGVVKRMERRAQTLKKSGPISAVKKVIKHVQKKRGAKKYSLKHPDLNHMSKKQIKYWANKKMKWRAETPMKKTRVMQKIFQVKNMEAKTLTKMNEINIGIGMNSTGVRSKMLKKGKNVIVNGELIQPGAIKAVHVNHVFQGQKERDPATENKSRDAQHDQMKMLRGKKLVEQVRLIKTHADREVKVAVSARAENDKPVSQKSVVNLKQLRRAVKVNKAATQTASSSPSKNSETSDLGDVDDEKAEAGMPTIESKDDQEIENEEEGLMEREDEDELSDDTDMSEALDETSLTGNIDNTQAERRY